MTILEASIGVTKLGLDTSPFIYTNDKGLSRVAELRVLVLDDLLDPSIPSPKLTFEK